MRRRVSRTAAREGLLSSFRERGAPLKSKRGPNATTSRPCSVWNRRMRLPRSRSTSRPDTSSCVVMLTLLTTQRSPNLSCMTVETYEATGNLYSSWFPCARKARRRRGREGEGDGVSSRRASRERECVCTHSRDDVVGNAAEDVERRVALGVRRRLGVDKAVAVDPVAGVDEEQVDTSSPRLGLHALDERVVVCGQREHREGVSGCARARCEGARVRARARNGRAHLPSRRCSSARCAGARGASHACVAIEQSPARGFGMWGRVSR